MRERIKIVFLYSTIGHYLTGILKEIFISKVPINIILYGVSSRAMMERFGLVASMDIYIFMTRLPDKPKVFIPPK